MPMVADACEPALEIWDTLCHIQVNFFVINHQESLCIDNWAQVDLWVNLTQNIADLESDHNHALGITFFMKIFWVTMRINLLNMYHERLLAFG